MAKASKDPTSFWEDVYKVSSEEFAAMGKFLIANEAPRPFGSEKVPPEEEDMTYSLMREDPEALFQFFTEQGASFESAVKYVARMRKRLGTP